jgi:nitroreductase
MTTGMKNDLDTNDMAMAFDQLTRNRRSIRGFLPDGVEQATLDQIFESAACAPSNCNTQPWQVYVASGELRDRLSELLLASIGEGEISLDFPYDAKYSDIYRQRQLDVGLMLYKALGITREDKEGKRQAFLRNLEFFGAAHVAFIFMPEWCGIREAADVGMYAQNLMLAMQAHGVASCPQTILSYNANLVREQFDIDTSFKLLFGISFGYEDKSLPENQIVPDRASLAESVHFCR